VAMGALYPLFGLLLNPVLAAAAMAMSSVSVVTNALRLRGFRRPKDANEILHPSLRSRVGEYAYLVAIALFALGIGAAALVYARPEHAAGMPPGGHEMGRTMVDESMQPAISAAEAGVRAELVAPPAAQPGVPVRLAYQLADLGTSTPLTDVVIGHEQPMHLIVVSRDLGQFQHVHPRPTGAPGEYAVDVQFPMAGTYILYNEFVRSNGQDIVQRDELTVGGPSGSAALAEDRAPKVVGDARVSLQGAGAIRAGQETSLTFRVEDPRTGEGIGDLQPYLGAPAHAVILSEDAGVFVHTHGEQVGVGTADHDAADEHATGVARYGPEIAIHHTFPAPGLYKLWGQFQDHDGRVITADFVVHAQ